MEEEEKDFYINYAVEDFSKEGIETELNAYYDLFGEHITNGYYIYSIESARQVISSFGLPSQTITGNNEYRDALFHINFTSLCMTRDIIGGTKSALIFGDCIHTQFTPLTLNKRHYSGIRWDLWYNDYSLTSLFSRTRPHKVAFRQTYRLYTPNSYLYYIDNGEEVSHANNPSGEDDWSFTSMYGDYDMLFGFHGQKNLADIANVGLSYVNHHHNDAKNGESWLGDIPADFAPEEIHFEIYDMSPDNLRDPGAWLHDIQMLINGVPAGRPQAFYQVLTDSASGKQLLRLVDQNNKLGFAPKEQSGPHPLICTFYPKLEAEVRGIGKENIKKVEFAITVSGNYLIFCSTEKFTPLYKHYGLVAPGKYGPIQYQISDIVDVKIDSTSNVGTPNLAIPSIGFPNKSYRSEVYFGDYIAKAPYLVADPNANVTTINYEYKIVLSSQVLSLNANGKLYGVEFAGEFSANAQRSRYPTKAGEPANDLYTAWYLQATRQGPQNNALLKNMYFKTDVYRISSKYEPNLPHYQVSRTFSRMSDISMQNKPFPYFPHYLDYPIQLCNFWSAIDDNDDNDFYAENERKPYPSEEPDTWYGNFFQDGSHLSNVGGASHLYLPSDFKVIYEDYDGVISERYDRNRNGVVDYQEDFLMFESDPPVLLLEADRNNNKVFDIEEDDLVPDYPYQLAYEFTSNGWRSMGIQGLKGGGNYVPNPYLNIEAGAVYEQILDPSLDGQADDLSNLNEGRNLSVYGIGKFDKMDREKGILYFAGEELKLTQDGIKNDAVQSRLVGSEQYYSLKPDMLELKSAMVSNTALGVEFTGIKNFRVTARGYYGLENHFASDSVFITQAIVPDTVLNDTTFYAPSVFQRAKVPYKNKLINSFIFMTKAAYTFRPQLNFEGPLVFLNNLNKLEVIPQYKIMYELHSSDEDDPRMGRLALDGLDRDSLFTHLWQWREFRTNNVNLLFSVPILRFNYKLGEKTYLEGGLQWKRVVDLIVAEESYFKKSTIVQVRSKNTYQGYEITLMLGLNMVTTEFDINHYFGKYEYGQDFNSRSAEVFVKIYAGGL